MFVIDDTYKHSDVTPIIDKVIQFVKDEHTSSSSDSKDTIFGKLEKLRKKIHMKSFVLFVFVLYISNVFLGCFVCCVNFAKTFCCLMHDLLVT